MIVVAAVSVALALALLLPPSVTGRPCRPPARLSGSAVPVVAGVSAAAVLIVLGGSGRFVVLALIAAAAGLLGARVLRARRELRLAHATSGRVLETCEQLAAELGSGSPPGAALDRAAADWPELAPIAESFRVGSDVPDAFRTLASTPGAGGLRVVGAAWQVAHRTGVGLADAVDHVARDLRAAESTRRIVEGELASARATARLVAALPLVALMMGGGMGGNPWGFLLGHPIGLACLGAGLGLMMLGLAWIEAIARDVDRG